MTVCNSIVLNTLHDFRDKGDNMLSTRSHFKAIEIDYNTLTKSSVIGVILNQHWKLL